MFIFSLAEPAVALTDVGMRVNMEAEGVGEACAPTGGTVLPVLGESDRQTQMVIKLTLYRILSTPL